MWTFKAYLRKEFIEATRQYKYLMLAVGIIAFAILDPIMLKLLPNLLKGKLPEEVVAFFVTTQTTVVQSYIKDLNQIGILFIIFIISGTLCEEIYNQKLVFPYSKGASPKSIVLVKFLHYIVTVGILTGLGFLINYYYATVLFPKTPMEFSNIFPAMGLVVLYFIFNISLTIFFSSIFKKGIVGGIIALAVSFGSSTLAGFDSIGKFIPYNLINCANKFSFEDSIETIILTVGLSLVLMILTMFRMSKVEVI